MVNDPSKFFSLSTKCAERDSKCDATRNGTEHLVLCKIICKTVMISVTRQIYKLRCFRITKKNFQKNNNSEKKNQFRFPSSNAAVLSE